MRACDSEIIVHSEYLVHGGGGDSLRSCINVLNLRNETTQTSHENGWSRNDQAKVGNPRCAALNNLACVISRQFDLITFVALSRVTCVT